MFSWNTGNWKRIGILDKRFKTSELKTTVLACDTVYFLCNQVNPIVGFDLVTEQLVEVPLMNFPRTVVWAFELRGCLSLIYSPGNLDVDIWMLKQPSDQNSWKKSFSFSCSTNTRHFISSKTRICMGVHFDGGLNLFDPSRDILPLSQRGVGFGYTYYY